MTIIIPPLSPFPGRGAAPEDYIAQADTAMQQLPGVIAGIQAVSDAFNLGAGVLSVGYLPAVPYVGGIAMTIATQTVEYGGLAYAPLLTALPFTTGGVFEADKFRLIQGLVASDLSASDGAARITYTAPGAGGVPSTVQGKLRESASITDTGGVGNYNPATGTGVNCINAISQIGARGPAGQIVRFPKILGQSNAYLLSYPSGFTVPSGSIIIDADPGVTLYTEGVQLECEFVRPTPQVFIGAASASLPVTYVAQPHGDPDQSESNKSRWLNRGDIVTPTLKMLDPRTGWRALLLTFPGAIGDGGDGAGFTGSTKISYDPTSVVVTATSGDGALHGGFMRPTAGDEIGAHLDLASGSTGYIPAVIFRSATGYAGVLLSVQGATSFVKKIGSALVQSAAGSLGMGMHQSYSPFSSIVTARMLSAYRYQVLVNGAVVHEGEMADPIQELGFGGYISGACNFRWTDLYLSRGHAPSAARTIGLFAIGDSITAEQHGCWLRHCRAALEGTHGIRVVQYHNQAVAGHDSSAQLAILRANGVPAGTTHTVIQVGTNDGQAGSSVATLVANVGEMIDRVTAASSRVVVSLPPLWYGQDQAGNRGQAALRYSGGTPYRVALMRLCAERGVPLHDSLPAYGPIVANFVNPAQDPNLVGRDPMVFDNLHPGALMRRLMGYAIAGIILGQTSHVGTSATPWTNLPSTWPAQNGWTIGADGGRFRISDAGSRRLRLALTFVGATGTDGTTVLAVGRLLWPSGAPITFFAWTDARERLLMVLGLDGQLKIYGASSLVSSTVLYVDTGWYEVD